MGGATAGAKKEQGARKFPTPTGLPSEFQTLKFAPKQTAQQFPSSFN